MRLDRLRRLGRHVPHRVRRRPKTTLAIVAVGASVALVLAVAFWPFAAASGPGSAGRPASGTGVQSDAPTFTYSASWSLLDLQRHIGAGEVVAITAAPPA